MRFRRIYWVTEQYDAQGQSEVTGVYTSIPDLIELGLGTRDVSNKTAGFRLSLVELDTSRPTLFCFSSPDFSEVSARLAPILQGGELTQDEVSRLRTAQGSAPVDHGATRRSSRAPG